jgi:hypothetical protein
MAMTLEEAVAWLYDVLADYPHVAEIEGMVDAVPHVPFPQSVWVRLDLGAEAPSAFWVVPLTDFVDTSEEERRAMRAEYERFRDHFLRAEYERCLDHMSMPVLSVEDES